jgi:predicted RNase H-like HicB family nuclease
MSYESWQWLELQIKFGYAPIMVDIKYCVYREDEHYVAQCLNVDVSSFGDTAQSAIENLTEAVELYFEDGPQDYRRIEDVVIGERSVIA